MAKRIPAAVRLAASILGKRGGRKTKGVSTPAKAAAARANGRKGGRPRKTPQAA